MKTVSEVASYAIYQGTPWNSGVIESLCRTLIVDGWAVFETIAEDLWEAAINAQPKILKKARKIKITFDDLDNFDFDIRGKMGTVAKNADGIGFRTLSKIIETYRNTFTDQWKPIEDALHSELLRYAAAVRNLIVHKRGIIDYEFDEQTTGIAGVPRFDRQGPPQELPITGELCVLLVDSCCMSAMHLINAVHAWIVGHAKSSAQQKEASDNEAI